MSLHDKFVWPKPNHKAGEILFRNVRTHRCRIVNILDGDPGFSFSIGLYLDSGHPELIIFGLPPDNASGIINDVGNRAAAGHDFGNGAVSDDLLEGGLRGLLLATALRCLPRLSRYGGLALCAVVDRVSMPPDHLVGPRTGAFPGKRDACRT